MGLLIAGFLALLHQTGAQQSPPLVAGGLFINHLLARKVGLFWLAAAVSRPDIDRWLTLPETVQSRPFSPCWWS